MNARKKSFYRKVIYVVAMAALLLVLFPLSRPATNDARGDRGSAGGVLAQMRAENGLSQAQLGEVDPTGEAIKLATLGMRGIAANLLWEKAIEYKKKKDWTNLAATLNQIIKLQPNFIEVWKHQAWNLSYNVSVEFDDYRDRYAWVMRGINFLIDGIKWNEREPRLWSDIGWFISQKIGRADEHKQFRRLFREDDEFHQRNAKYHPPSRSRLLDSRDNWLVGKQWYLGAEDLVDNQGASLRKKSPLLFRSDAPMCQINYADALEEDGTFGRRAIRAWEVAAGEWADYGNLEIPTTYGSVIQLKNEEAYRRQAAELVEQLGQMAPGVREEIIAEKRAALPKNQREALDTPPAKRDEKQHQLAYDAEAALETTHLEVAQRLTGLKKRDAVKIAERAMELEQLAGQISRYRDIVNFEYWRLRCEVEQTPEAVAAREAVHQAEQSLEEGNLPEAIERYAEGFRRWRGVLDAHPALLEDRTTGEDLTEVIDKYRELLVQLDEPFPTDFPLQDVLDRYGDLRPSAAPTPDVGP